MEFMTLEQELRVRVFLHKIAIVKSALANTYIAEELNKGGITLSLPCIEKNALDFSDNIVAKILSKGDLDEAYNKAWEVMGDRIPDDFTIM